MSLRRSLMQLCSEDKVTALKNNQLYFNIYNTSTNSTVMSYMELPYIRCTLYIRYALYISGRRFSRNEVIVWVGAVQSNLTDESSLFHWEKSGAPVSSSLWCSWEPNDHKNNQDHATLQILGFGYMCLNYRSASAQSRYICESSCWGWLVLITARIFN